MLYAMVILLYAVCYGNTTVPYWRVIRRILLIGAYSLLSAYFVAVLNIPALKKALFIRRISRRSAYLFPVEV